MKNTKAKYKIDPKIVETFQLSPRDQETMIRHSKHDHEAYNKRLAKNYKLF